MNRRSFVKNSIAALLGIACGNNFLQAESSKIDEIIVEMVNPIEDWYVFTGIPSNYLYFVTDMDFQRRIVTFDTVLSQGLDIRSTPADKANFFWKEWNNATV